MNGNSPKLRVMDVLERTARSHGPRPALRARRQGFSLLVLPLLKAQHTQVMQRRAIVRLDMQGTLQRSGGLVQLAIFILPRGGFDQGG